MNHDMSSLHEWPMLIDSFLAHQSVRSHLPEFHGITDLGLRVAQLLRNQPPSAHQERFQAIEDAAGYVLMHPPMAPPPGSKVRVSLQMRGLPDHVSPAKWLALLAYAIRMDFQVVDPVYLQALEKPTVDVDELIQLFAPS